MDPTLVVPESSAARRQHTCRRCAGGVSLALPWPPRALAEALRTLERWLRSPLFPLQGPSGERGEQGAPGPSGFQVGSRPGFLCGPLHTRAPWAAAGPGDGGPPTEGDQGNEVSLQGLPEGGGSKLAPLLMLVTLASRDFLALPVPQVKVENQVTR